MTKLIPSKADFNRLKQEIIAFLDSTCCVLPGTNLNSNFTKHNQVKDATLFFKFSFLLFSFTSIQSTDEELMIDDDDDDNNDEVNSSSSISAARRIVNKDIYLGCPNRDPNRECQLLDFRLRRLVDYYRIYLSMEQSEVINNSDSN